MSEPSAKKARTTPPYTLVYWPTLPGRGEFVRLVLEATATPYTDICNGPKPDHGPVMDALNSDTNPAFAPPLLKVAGEGKDGAELVLYQTPNILLYLGEKLGLAGSEEGDKWAVNAYALTALDLNNEAHDTHHPIANILYYEDQKEEALKKAKNVREIRIPKFFSFFERVLKSNEKAGQGKHLVGEKLTYADTTLWHVLNGLQHAFPKEIEARKPDYPLLFDTFYPAVEEQEHLKRYLASERRLPYGQGIFRHYPELDRQ
ncbi:glutathione S-transferase [Mytilinidion resinicola]|uniref:Glutathione S-transferase n=1 Tax=Mytilinidion resinicola TaxID=574789 RepID=A0A6A6Z9X6_9PEZI|nr:glutathione S-transferase [Mytilinidion resinicola]KAF2817007.1 glutathione S-transferase [Mytilinidion resinicola]